MKLSNIWKKKQSLADEKLEQVKNILFPAARLQKEEIVDGKTITHHIDFSADWNLEAALTDLQEGHNDIVTQNTINSVIKSLIKVRKILGVEMKIDKTADTF